MIASISKEPDAIHVYFTTEGEQEEALVIDIGKIIESRKFTINPAVMQPEKPEEKGPRVFCLILEPKPKA